MKPPSTRMPLFVSIGVHMKGADLLGGHIGTQVQVERVAHWLVDLSSKQTVVVKPAQEREGERESLDRGREGRNGQPLELYRENVRETMQCEPLLGRSHLLTTAAEDPPLNTHPLA